MRLTSDQGVEFWNDSCATNELAEAVEHGAVGATSNPVIVFPPVKQDPAGSAALIDRLAADHPEEGEEEIAWRLIEELGRRAAALLAPVHRETGGRRGFLSMQVNPKLY